MRFPHPFEGVRPPTDYWVDRPEVYSSNAQPTGTNRPNTCHTNPQHNQQPSWPTTGAARHKRHDRQHTTVDTATANTQSRPHNPTPTTTPTPTKTGGQGPVATGVHKVTAATATGKHPDPSRTRKLSLPAPMVLQPRGCGRVGRRRTCIANGRPVNWSPVVLFPALFRTISLPQVCARAGSPQACPDDGPVVGSVPFAAQ